MFPETSQQTTVEELLEAMISMWPLPRLYSKDEQDKLQNHESEVLAFSCIVSSHYPSVASEDIAD